MDLFDSLDNPDETIHKIALGKQAWLLKSFALPFSEANTAGFEDFQPQACLINCYQPGARMGLHQDKDEQNLTAPIVSVSLGIPATFLFGGLQRQGKTQSIPLQHGDVVVWGGEDRLRYHGIKALADTSHPDYGACRFNLTFRRVTS